MSSTTDTRASQPTPIDLKQRELDNALENPLATASSGKDIIAWTVNIIQLLYALIKLMFCNLFDYLKRIELNIGEIEDKIDTIRDATPAAAMTTTLSRAHRCTKCHARGHDITVCRTTNPAAMRKRVGENAKRKKMASNPSLNPFASTSPPFPLYGTYPSPTPNPVAAYAFVADAQELRRRRQQSDRDKRRVRRSTTADPP